MYCMFRLPCPLVGRGIPWRFSAAVHLMCVQMHVWAIELKLGTLRTILILLMSYA